MASGRRGHGAVGKGTTADLTRPPRQSSVVARSVDELEADLVELVFLERASAHVLAGWIVKIPQMDIKTTLAQHFQEDIEHATELRHRLVALVGTHGSPLRISTGFQQLMRSVDAARTPTEFLIGLYLIVKRRQVSRYRALRARMDKIADAPSLRSIRRILPEKRRQVAWAEATIRRLEKPREIRRITVGFEVLWRNRHSGTALLFDKALWPPLDRARVAIRPDGMVRGTPGALRLMPLDPQRNQQDIGVFLHGFLNEEYTTMELVSRNSYEHPAMPWGFHLDAARHTADEARHARIIERAALSRGVRYGQYPIYTSSYDGQYEFEPCKRGSKKELLWRLLLRETFHEGLALDSLAFEVEKRTYLGQPDLADVFRLLLADEMFHAKSGLKWSRFLCGDDEGEAMRERELAHDYLVERAKDSRARFVAGDMAAAVAEVVHLEEVKKHSDLPIRRTVNVRARREAGFTEPEIQQIVDWGYVQRT